MENVDYAMFLEHRRWLESRPQDRGGRVKAKNEKYELSRSSCEGKAENRMLAADLEGK